MGKRNIIIGAVVLVMVVTLVGGGSLWFLTQQDKKLELATTMMCTTFALQMTQVHKQRAMLMEAIGNMKDQTAAEGDKASAETATDSEKFLFSEAVDKKIDEFVTTLDGKYDDSRPMKQQSPEVLKAFSDMAQVLESETGSYWGECLAEMKPAVEQCSAFQDNEAEMAECMKSQGGKIRELMGKYLKLDLNS